MISSVIREQIKAGEGSAMAFITNASNFDQIASTVCALLNSKGGIVFVGVQKDGTILGVGHDPEAVRRHLETELQKAISPRALFTVSIDSEDDKSLVSIEVPAGRDFPYVIDSRVLVRRGKRTTPADLDMLRELIQGRSIEPDRWERRPATGFGEEDLSQPDIQATIEDAKKYARLAFDNPDDTRSVLRELGMAAPNGFTQGCAVLFGKKPALLYPQCRVRFIQYETDKTGAAYSDNQWIEGPLVSVFYKLIERVASSVRVQALFIPGDHNRKDRANYSQDALREGVVNALAHRDYAAFSGGASVSIYPDRIEIWNSGRLPPGLKVGDLKKVHPSIPTNPDVAHVLYLRGLMERIGRGTQKIIMACEDLGAAPPRWTDNPTGVTLTIYSATVDRAEIGLNARQSEILEGLRPGDSMRLIDYVRIHEVSERQARRELAKLEDAGFLIRVGAARATSYRRTDRTL